MLGCSFGSAWPHQPGAPPQFSTLLAALVSQQQCHMDVGTGSWCPQLSYSRVTAWSGLARRSGNHASLLVLTSQLQQVTRGFRVAMPLLLITCNSISSHRRCGNVHLCLSLSPPELQPSSHLQICKVTGCSGNSPWCLRHGLSSHAKRKTSRSLDTCCRHTGQMISGCNSMVPGTATVLGTTCCSEQPGKCNYGKNTAGMAATATGEEHGGCEPEQRNSAHLCLQIAAC